MADLRKCIGSKRFEIGPHEAPVEDFPVQPSQKDGLGRMCKTHWNEYTNALRRAAEGGGLARPAEVNPEAPAAPNPKRGKGKGAPTAKGRRPAARKGGTPLEPVGGSQGDAG